MGLVDAGSPKSGLLFTFEEGEDRQLVEVEGVQVIGFTVAFQLVKTT